MGKTNVVGFLGISQSMRKGARENTGNFLHGYAAREIVGSHVDIAATHATPERIEQLRSTLSHVGFVAATTIPVNQEPGFVDNHPVLADFIERLGLPVIVFGLGAQAPLDATVADAWVNDKTKRLLSVLSAHARSIAVRGQYTADLCRSLGIANVAVVGCQSCFLGGTPDFRFPELPGNVSLDRTVVNITRPIPEAALLREAMRHGAAFIGQSSHFEYLLKDVPPPVALDDLPAAHLSLLPPDLKRLFADGRLPFEEYHRWIAARFEQFYNMPEWFDFLRGNFDLSVGTRFHGNMAALQAGIPALWVVHDSRTREFCDLLGLPQAPIAKVVEGMPIGKLAETYLDGSAFNRLYPENYARFHAYLEQQGVRHRLAPPRRAATGTRVREAAT